MAVSTSMRVVPVVGSVLLHLAIAVPVALAVGHATAEDELPAPAPAADEPVAIAWVDAPPALARAIEPIDVVLLDSAPHDAAAAPRRDAATAPPRITRGSAGAASRVESASTGTTDRPTAPDTREGTAAGRGMFAMRGPSLEAPAEVMAKLAEGGSAPVPVHISGTLHDAPNGRAQVDDLVTTATVERDGTVHFADKPEIDVKFHIPAIPTPSGIVQGVKDAGKALGKWYADPYEQTRYGTYQDLPRHLQASDPTGPNPRCASFGDTSCDDPNAPQFEKEGREAQRGQIGFGGTFDATAALMKKLHAGDPWAARKKKILAATFDERAAKGDAYHGDQLAHASEIMRGNLLRLWASTPGAAARREALFEMWDECAEGEGPSGEAGARARAMVIGWIRTYLPAGSADAFPAAELAALSARRTSHEAFAPY